MCSNFTLSGCSDVGTVKQLGVVERSCNAVKGSDLAFVLIGLPVERVEVSMELPIANRDEQQSVAALPVMLVAPTCTCGCPRYKN